MPSEFSEDIFSFLTFGESCDEIFRFNLFESFGVPFPVELSKLAVGVADLLLPLLLLSDSCLTGAKSADFLTSTESGSSESESEEEGGGESKFALIQTN